MLMIAASGAVLIALGFSASLFRCTFLFVTATRTVTDWRPVGWPYAGVGNLFPASVYNFAVVPHVHERDAFWEMKRKAKRTKSLTTMKKFICRKTRCRYRHCSFLHHLRFRHDLDIWWLAIVGFAGMIITWIVKASTRTWITTCRWQKSKNWKTAFR